VLVLTGVLNRFLFKPILRVMAEREHAITSAREQAERAANEARLQTEADHARRRLAADAEALGAAVAERILGRRAS
jgi:F0F1-type ATP synthase membrane subunit b/b'